VSNANANAIPTQAATTTTAAMTPYSTAFLGISLRMGHIEISFKGRRRFSMVALTFCFRSLELQAYG
jgi:hypothetical protein